MQPLLGYFPGRHSICALSGQPWPFPEIYGLRLSGIGTVRCQNSMAKLPNVWWPTAEKRPCWRTWLQSGADGLDSRIVIEPTSDHHPVWSLVKLVDRWDREWCGIILSHQAPLPVFGSEAESVYIDALSHSWINVSVSQPTEICSR